MTESRVTESQEISSAANKHTDESAEGGSSSETIPTFFQLQSGFFSALPLEIRQNIYRQLWIAAGSTQHVYKAGPSFLAPLSHCQCISDPNAEDIREIELTRILATPPLEPAEGQAGALTEEAAIQRDEINDWRLRNASVWCHHWACEEHPPVLRPVDGWIGDKDDDKKKQRVMVKEFSPFLSILLTCKRMHQEAIDSIYDAITFSFIGSDALSRFLATTSTESLLRITALHLVWSAPIESYMDPEDEEAMAAKMKWTDLWTAVAMKLPHLKDLQIWMYPQYARYPMPHEEWFLPLHQFKHVPRHDITLMWFMDPSLPDDGPLDFLEEAPFTYERVKPLLENPLHLNWRRLIGLFLDEPRYMPTRRQRKKRYAGRS
ncbi:hypothetical protein CkaCkLH20_12119 [Colletotrichum karsti]|uniref:DUF7730 domain-containing protein n=1 Tax=Colletotrichum karsti TaxID=1095194 RepID=A0A9P6LFK5_9PEZI|nr:uncharacterized protein CkaCkLH20_12119 [Colletotrichum karsti]KAF9870452.1 hypothetical protein CkaCkLH20_12119 [Colletotrichum karsti]